jgi:hypothetical protein
MFYNIKMKLLIGGKSRSIYMRKDGSAYYKSGGENVDVSYMFKKNGGGLKKQYIGGVQDNLGKVEQKKRSKKGFKQILGGAISNINFDKIEIKSEDIMNGNYQGDKAPEQLQKICCLALYGLGAAMTGELEKVDPAKDTINVTVGKNLDTFLTYLNKSVLDDPAKSQINEILSVPDKNAIFGQNVVKDELKTFIEKLGFANVTNATDFSSNEKCVTVTRAYILNKILQCFEGDDGDCIAHSSELLPLAAPDFLHLAKKTHFINPIDGKLNPGLPYNPVPASVPDMLEKLKKVADRIFKVSLEADPDNIAKSAKNLHTVLFLEEQIGAPASSPALSAAAGAAAD